MKQHQKDNLQDQQETWKAKISLPQVISIFICNIILTGLLPGLLQTSNHDIYQIGGFCFFVVSVPCCVANAYVCWSMYIAKKALPGRQSVFEMIQIVGYISSVIGIGLLLEGSLPCSGIFFIVLCFLLMTYCGIKMQELNRLKQDEDNHMKTTEQIQPNYFQDDTIKELQQEVKELDERLRKLEKYAQE